ncbi:hypothetical protein ILUMI_24356 [Ignelater luminosus]|uniref:Uncharacterized protein n=1 Tax=Ignelater luminosus TaxID=2038154 RepID=A0A8K0CDJ7_IGNLU|nr:hypothetical protein ILUMI_24356 [Ignelater luminosus]
MPRTPTTWPRYFSGLRQKWHFLGFRQSLAALRRRSTLRTLSKCSGKASSSISNGYATQKCTYDGHYKQIRCSDMTSTKQINDELEKTLKQNNLNLTDLESLIVNGYKLNSFNIKSLTFSSDLKELSVTNSEIVTVEGDDCEESENGVLKGSGIKDLNLSSNKITAINPKAFVCLNGLQKLNLKGNNLTQIDRNIFQGLSIKKLILSGNQFTIIKSRNFYMLNISELDMSDNKISAIDENTFSSSTIKKLILDYNEILTIKPGVFNGLSELEQINLGDNKISKIDKDAFLNLPVQILNLPRNQIKTIESEAFGSLPNLRELYLTYNQITKLNGSSFEKSKIQKLDLHENRIVTLESTSFGKLIHLKEIDLGENLITRIENNTFLGTVNLRILSLFNNQIMILEPGAFNGLINLERLYLNGNSLSSIDKNVFLGSSVRELGLSDNQIEQINTKQFEGLGYQTALALAGRGCRVIIACRSDCEEAKKNIITQTGNPNVVTKKFNLASLKSVRELAKNINENEERLDILINNAGILGTSEFYTEDELDVGMQVNFFGHFLLTHLLIGLLKKSSPSKIIFISSIAAYVNNLSVDNLNYPQGIRNDIRMYANSKLCCLIAADQLSKKLSGSNITAYSVHPGLIETRIWASYVQNSPAVLKAILNILEILLYVLKLFVRSPEEGIQTILHIALSKEIVKDAGKFFAECKPRERPAKAEDPYFATQIWKASEKHVKLNVNEII